MRKGKRKTRMIESIVVVGASLLVAFIFLWTLGVAGKRADERMAKIMTHERIDILNLITDMIMNGATEDELMRAVRYSMTVIAAEKADKNREKSEEENGISELKEKYEMPELD